MVITGSSPFTGLQTLIQSWGIGPMHANTLLLNWLEQGPGEDQERRELLYGKQLRRAYLQGCNLLIWSGDEESIAALSEKEGSEKRIDVWWNGDRSSRLMQTRPCTARQRKRQNLQWLQRKWKNWEARQDKTIK